MDSQGFDGKYNLSFAGNIVPNLMVIARFILPAKSIMELSFSSKPSKSINYNYTYLHHESSKISM